MTNSVLDSRGVPVPSAAIAAIRQRAAMSTAYQAADFAHPALANWTPFGWSGQSSQAFGRDTIASRIHDLVRNDGYASAAVSRLVDETVGSGFSLNSTPNAATLGLTQDEADEIGDQIEAEWADFWNDDWCDAERMATGPGLLGLAMRHRFTDGEAAAHVVWRGDAVTGAPLAPTGWGTCVHVIDPARISNPRGAMDSPTLQQGVALDEWGAASGYHVRRRHPGDSMSGLYGGWQWDYVPRDIDGRPNFILTGERKRAGERRAIAEIVSVVREHKQTMDINDYEMQAVALNAVMAAFVTSPFDLEELSETFDAGNTAAALKAYEASQAAYYAEAPVRMPGAQVNFLRAGENVTLTKPEHPNANFEVFFRQALRKIASAVGLTYEMLTMDWSQVNYSSARAAMLVIYRSLTARKDRFIDGFMRPIFRAWLEEAFDRRMIRIPGRAVSFEARPAAWCASEWIGPGRGWVDPEKEAKAATLRMAAGISTLRQETAEQGGDWKRNVIQIAREQKFKAAHGIDPTAGDRIAVAAASAPPAPEKEGTPA